MSFFRKLFTAPVFDDENKTQQAYILHVILWTLVCVPIPFVIYTLVLTPENSSRTFTQAAFGESVNVILLFMLRRGYVRSASIIQVSTFWFFFTVTALTDNGVQGEAYLLGYGLVIAIAGILLGGTGASVFTFMSLAAGGWMVYRQTQGIINSNFDNPPLTTWIVSVVLFPVGAILQHLSARAIKIALSRARASEEKYRLISRVSSDYTFATEIHKDGSASLSWVAGAFEKMTGYTYEEYVASGEWPAHVHPNDLAKDEEDMEKLHENQDIKSEIRTFTKNGEIRWERIFAHPVWDEKENRLIGIVGAVQDVTNQKNAEEILSETLLRQAAILNNIPDAAWLKDKEGRYIAVNEQFYTTTHLKGDEIIGKTDFDLSPENIAKSYREGDSIVMSSKQRKITEEQMTDREGRAFWVETAKTPIFNSAGEVVGTTGISHDITERKQSEIHEQNRRTMLEKVVRLGKLVTEADDLNSTIKKIWHGGHDELGFDRIAVFLYNPERRSMDGSIGTDKNGKMVDEWDDWFLIDEDAAFSHTLKKPDGIYFTHNFDLENKIEEGHEMFGVKDYAAVAAWAGDKPVAVICVDQCITHRPITTEQLEALRLFGGYAGLAIENARLNETIHKELSQKKIMIEELETKNAELERFTYTVSHDLKSPLVTIKGFLGYLERDAQEGKYEKFRHDVQRIEAAVEKMQNLLKDLLELSRVGRLMNAPVEVTFEEIVKDALEIVHGQIQAKNILIEINHNNATIKCDRVRIVEVLQNLIDNAVKFMGGQSSPRIEIGAFTNDKNETVFFVKDNGAGMAPEFHDKIFGLFNKLNIESDGTGIGLALVKRIIEVHGGRIWVESQIGKGTTFYFTLP